MKEALELLAAAARQFRFYEQNHRAKNTEDSLKKADVNSDYASEIEEYLASQPLETFVARTAHQANKAWCEYLGDTSQEDWPHAPEWAQKSAFDGVRFHKENADAGDSASHDNWMAMKLAEGWSYGPVKNPDLKLHHCIVPFSELPPEQQFKDRLFRSVVHAGFHL